MVCLEGLRKSTKLHSPDSWSKSRDFNLGPRQYQAGVLSTLTRLVETKAFIVISTSICYFI